MTITFEIPADVKQQVRTDGQDPNREVKEVYVMKQYRQAKITHRQLQDVIDLSFPETEHLLKRRGLGQDLEIAEFGTGPNLLDRAFAK